MSVDDYCGQNPSTLGCPPVVCCDAVTADCLACSAGMSVDDYCGQNPSTLGCPPVVCCDAMTADCLACSAGMSVDDYCRQNPSTQGCAPMPTLEPTPMPTPAPECTAGWLDWCEERHCNPSNILNLFCAHCPVCS